MEIAAYAFAPLSLTAMKVCPSVEFQRDSAAVVRFSPPAAEVRFPPPAAVPKVNLLDVVAEEVSTDVAGGSTDVAGGFADVNGGSTDVAGGFTDVLTSLGSGMVTSTIPTLFSKFDSWNIRSGLTVTLSL